MFNRMSNFPKSFWTVWSIELWERFGFYGVQSILALYFVDHLNFSEQESMYIFGIFSSFLYGFVWVGGYIGDKILGSKVTIILGAIILLLSYFGLSLSSNKQDIYYSLAGIIVGNALFKANPSSLISKMFNRQNNILDEAMTIYYMSINIGALLSMSITPILVGFVGWNFAFWLCPLGLLIGLSNFIFFSSNLSIYSNVKKINIKQLLFIIICAISSIWIIGYLLNFNNLCIILIYLIVFLGFFYFLFLAFNEQGIVRKKMIIAFILLMQSIVFFVLYNQMPTSLTFFANHNVNNKIFGFNILPSQYQVLNPLFIVLFTPMLTLIYRKFYSTHITKFCIGMTVLSMSFIILFLSKFTAVNGYISCIWLLISYFFQSISELLVSALGLSMIAKLCPSSLTGFVMGVWFLTSMLAGPLGAKLGSLTTMDNTSNINNVFDINNSMQIYTNIFGKIGLFVFIFALLMWLLRPILHRYMFLKDNK